MMANVEKNGKIEQEEHIEEMLELLWTTDEEHDKVVRPLLYKKYEKETVDDTLCRMSEQNLILFRDSEVLLTKSGRDKARHIIRRHRLAERLLHDVLEASDEVFEHGACQYEHFINEEVTTSICTLLGHPGVCPHGKIIPPGKCCSDAKRKLQPLLGPLSRLRSGVNAEVAYIITGSPTSLEWLSSIGVAPGLKFKVHHRKPSLVIQFGETKLALDDNVAGHIYVRVIPAEFE